MTTGPRIEPGPARWTFVSATALGDATARYELGVDGLAYVSDDVLDPGDATVRWADVIEGGTATMAGMGGRGAPDLPRWIPSQLEWLVLSVRGGPGFMRRLPDGAARDEIVAAARARLADRWIGDRVALPDAQRRLGLAATEWSTTKVVAIVVAVLAMLALAIIVLGLMATPFFLVPACVLSGAWLLRSGLARHRSSVAAAGMPVACVAAARPGPVHLEGIATTERPLSAAVTGRPSVWWDASVFLQYEDGDRAHEWKQVAAREGGTIDVVVLDDASGRVPVWLEGAELLVAADEWRSGRDALPAEGVALLDALGFPWNGTQTILVREQRLEAGAALTVFGTIDARRDVPDRQHPTGVERLTRSFVTGRWRRTVVAAVPTPLRVPVAVLIGYLDLFARFGSAKARPVRAIDTTAPAMPPDAVLVWRGRRDTPFLVSNRPVGDALQQLRRRALVAGAIGAALLCFAAYQVIEWFVS